MHPRLDPGCEGAVAMERRFRDQRALLVDPSGKGKLSALVGQTQEKQVVEHIGACARCRGYDPRCPECRFDVRTERHGWMCHQQASRWQDAFPWNWRARVAPGAPPPARAEPGVTRRIEVEEPRRAEEPPTPRAARGSQPARPTSRVPAAKAAPPPLAAHFKALGVTAKASQEEVRAAFREQAQRYHPDKVAHMAPEFREVAERRMKEINEAYEIIKRSWG